MTFRRFRRGGWRIVYAVGKRLPCSYAGRLGRIGKGLRVAAARRLLGACGQRVNVETGASFGAGHCVYIGNDSDLGINCTIYGELHIGDNSFMGPDVTIWTTNHAFDRTDVPIRKQGNRPLAAVWIGDDVWIGTRVILLPGVRIGNHVVVAAGAVVTKSVPDWAVVGGNPARVLKFRNLPAEPANPVTEINTVLVGGQS